MALDPRPLDGTKDVLEVNGEYAVHLALVHQQLPSLGVVLLPELDELWFGWIDPSGIELPVAVRKHRMGNGNFLP